MKTLLLVLLIGGCSVDALPFGGETGGSAGGRAAGLGDAAISMGGIGGAVVADTGGAVMVAVTGTGGATVATGGAAGGAVVSTGGAAGGVGGEAYVPPTNCYAGRMWDGANDKYMRPGAACGSCHTSFTIAGTVFVNSTEPTNCYGVGGVATLVKVLVLGADGGGVALLANEAGNFWTDALISFPATVSTTYGSGQLRMQGAVTSGDCNSCHGANGYPGRVLPP